LFPSNPAIQTYPGQADFANATYRKVATNGNNALYPDGEYSFQNNLQNGLPFFSSVVACSSSSSTLGILISSTYSGAAPVGMTIYISKGTLTS
jgi:hypothetical protein